MTPLCPTSSRLASATPEKNKRRELTQTKSMRQPLLTNNHGWPIRPPTRSDNLIPRPLRNPMIIPAKVEEQFRQRLPHFWDAPDIIGPLVGCDGLHFGGSEVAVPLVWSRRISKWGQDVHSLSDATFTLQEATRRIEDCIIWL